MLSRVRSEVDGRGANDQRTIFAVDQKHDTSPARIAGEVGITVYNYLIDIYPEEDLMRFFRFVAAGKFRFLYHFSLACNYCPLYLWPCIKRIVGFTSPTSIWNP